MQWNPALYQTKAYLLPNLGLLQNLYKNAPHIETKVIKFAYKLFVVQFFNVMYRKSGF